MSTSFDLSRYQDPLTVQRVILSARTIAIVGLSKNHLRASHFVGFYLRRHGYRVIAINPREPEILGEKSFNSLVDVPVPVDIVNVFRAPDAVPGIAREAVAIGATSLWCQFGVVSEEGGPVIIRLQSRSFIAPVPDVLVSAAGDERTVVLLPPMRGWEYAWCLLPLIVLLVFVRSPISGLLGALVTYVNVMVLYKAPNRSAGIARAGLVSFLVLTAYFGATYLLLAPFRSHVGAAPAPAVSASPSR